MSEMRVWKLHVDGNKYCSFVPHDLRYFESRFICQPLADHWDAPAVGVSGRSKPAGDFAVWMARSPVVSEQARDLIADLAGGDVELLPFHTVKSKRYFVLNVLRCEDYLDMPRCDFTVCYERFVFRPNLPVSLPPIFKCPGRWGEIFITGRFAEMLVKNNLRGVALADPAESTMPLILAKAEINRYPGLIT